MVRRLTFLLAANLVFFSLCLLFLQTSPTAHQAEKQAAVALAGRAQAVLGPRLSGPEFTLITTTLAPHQAKLLSRHPDFAAVVVGWLAEAGVGTGSRVAVNLSGSFPALNIAVLAAIQAVGAEPVITSSVGASTWGATDPEFTWLDMERQLRESALWPWKSAAASPGGVGDRGGGLVPEGKALAISAIERNEVPLMQPANLAAGVNHRLELYRGPSDELPPVLVNVGGSHVIFGESGHRSPLPQGLNVGYHPLLAAHDGLAAAFLQSNRPVIHILNIAQLAAQYGIQSDTPPGKSGAFLSRQLPLLLRIAVGVWVIGCFMILWRGRPQKEL
jgi:poly-gamma-glutamate system protein